jgi:hypothetical protein
LLCHVERFAVAEEAVISLRPPPIDLML